MMSLNNDYDNIETNYNNFYFFKIFDECFLEFSCLFYCETIFKFIFVFYLAVIDKKAFVGPGPGNYNSSVNISKKTPSWKYLPFLY